MKPLLSICIPTYNRGSFLKETIKNVINEVRKVGEGYSELTEICVSDNASTDNTQSIVDELKKDCDIPIFFNRNEKNEGPDINFLNVVAMATGEFVWLLGSDDLLVNGSVNFIMNFIKRNKNIDIIFLVSYKYYGRLQKFDGEIGWKLETKENFYYYKSLAEASSEIFEKCGLISHLCFRKSQWDDINFFHNYLGLGYIHVFKVLAMLKNGSNAVLIKSPPLFVYNAFNDSIDKEYGTFARFLMDVRSYYTIPEAVLGKANKDAKRITGRELLLRFKPLLIVFTVARLSLKERFELIREFVSYYHTFFKFYLWIYPFLFFPLGCCGHFLGIFKVESVATRLRK